jgi:hypothetical protein
MGPGTAKPRFVVLAAFNNAGVLITILTRVEQMPETTKRNFQDSTYACANKSVGGAERVVLTLDP